MATTTWTADDVPGQAGRTAVVTGANTGLGYETALVLARRGAHVVLAVRDIEKGKAAAARITAQVPGAEVDVQRLDLSSLASIREASAELREALPRLDLLINNAGVMYTPRSTTADGFELQFGTNHLGHFALTGLLLDRVLATPGSRIVTVSSVAHRIRADIHFDDLQWERGYDRVAAYGQAKLANLMFTYELQRRLAVASADSVPKDSASADSAPGGSTIAVAAHPGFSDTELMRNMPRWLRVLGRVVVPLIAQKPDQGALPTLRAATDPTVEGGQYYGPSGLGETRGAPVLVRSSDASHDVAVQRRLWAVSEDLTGVEYPPGAPAAG